jgi:hypothetical protein
MAKRPRPSDAKANGNGKKLGMRELTWILFLRILDEREPQDAEAAEAVGSKLTPSIDDTNVWMRKTNAPKGLFATFWTCRAPFR